MKRRARNHVRGDRSVAEVGLRSLAQRLAPLHRGRRYPAEVIAQAIWLSFCFPLRLRMAAAMLAERGIVVSHETIRRWALTSGATFAAGIRKRQTGDLCICRLLFARLMRRGFPKSRLCIRPVDRRAGRGRHIQGP
jgi:hypothetical protein